ncbi:hypothetical protein N7501_002728 [Penicillium viridicatum]|nr:hypothetical protein N7501_002728 [Penicillium viridicatum]
MRTELQLSVVRGIAFELSEKHRMIQHATIAMLVTKLEIATNNAESTIKIHRWKYALMNDRTIEDPKEWQSLFDPSWYLIMMPVDRQIDDALRESRISSAQSLRIVFHLTDAYTPLVRLLSDSLISINPQTTILLSAGGPEARQWPIAYPAKVEDTKKYIQDLTRRLTRSDTMKFGLLSREGYTQQD